MDEDTNEGTDFMFTVLSSLKWPESGDAETLDRNSSDLCTKTQVLVMFLSLPQTVTFLGLSTGETQLQKESQLDIINLTRDVSD